MDSGVIAISDGDACTQSALASPAPQYHTVMTFAPYILRIKHCCESPCTTERWKKHVGDAAFCGQVTRMQFVPK